MLRGTGGGGGGGGGGGFTLQINGSQAAAGNGRTFLLGRTTGGSPERVTPLSEYACLCDCYPSRPYHAFSTDFYGEEPDLRLALNGRLVGHLLSKTGK